MSDSWEICKGGVEDIISKLSDNADEKCNFEYLKELGICENAEDLARKMRTDLRQGISQDEKSTNYSERKQHFGDNSVSKIEMKPLFRVYLGVFLHKMLGMDMVIALLTIILHIGVSSLKYYQGYECVDLFYLEWVSLVIILVFILMASMVGTINERAKSRKMIELATQVDATGVSVIRGGKHDTIPLNEVLSGDIVEVNAGDKVPGDGVILQSYDLSVDESGMTGETEPRKKNQDSNILMMAETEVVEGTGRMLVLAVGQSTQMGQLIVDEDIEYKEEEEEETPIQRKLQRLSLRFCYFVFAVILSLIPLLILAFVSSKFLFSTWTSKFTRNQKCYSEEWRDSDELNTISDCSSISDDLIKIGTSLIFVSTILLLAVPEGLPVMYLKYSLSVGVKALLKDKVLVRQLRSCEMIGFVDTLVTEKTGTLTMNQLRVSKAWVSGHEFLDDQTDVYENYASMMPPKVRTLITEGISINSTANLIQKDELAIYNPSIPINEQMVVQGNQTEAALLFFCEINMKTPYLPIRMRYEESDLIVQKFHFSASRKRSSCIVKKVEKIIDTNNDQPEQEEEKEEKKKKKYRLYCKGASEIILNLSNRMMNDEGEVVSIESSREQIEGLIQSFSQRGLRTLALAYKDIEKLSQQDEEEEEENFDESIEHDLILYLIVGVQDQIRSEVESSIQECVQNGINVRMITGDNSISARSVAEKLGMYDETQGHVIMEGREFSTFTDVQLLSRLQHIKILSRARPADKKRFVKLLMRVGHCVGVTGDSTSDAPALKAADVGLALGESGTEIAKAAADMVILDDSFSTIVKCVMRGRGLVGNVKKILQFQLTMNISALAFLFLTALINMFLPTTGLYDSQNGKFASLCSPISILQIFYINFVVILLSSQAIMSDSDLPSKKIENGNNNLQRRNIMNGKVWFSIFFQSAFQVSILLFLYYINVVFSPTTLYTKCCEKNTMVFNTFVFLQIFNTLNCRRVNMEWNIFANLHKNLRFVVPMLFVVLNQVMFTQSGMVIPFRVILGTNGLGVVQWIVSILLAAACIPAHFFKNFVLFLFFKYVYRPKKSDQGFGYNVVGDGNIDLNDDDDEEEEEEEVVGEEVIIVEDSGTPIHVLGDEDEHDEEFTEKGVQGDGGEFWE